MGVGGAAVVAGLLTAILLGLRSQRAFNGMIDSPRTTLPGAADRASPASDATTFERF